MDKHHLDLKYEEGQDGLSLRADYAYGKVDEGKVADLLEMRQVMDGDQRHWQRRVKNGPSIIYLTNTNLHRRGVIGNSPQVSQTKR